MKREHPVLAFSVGAVEKCVCFSWTRVGLRVGLIEREKQKSNLNRISRRCGSELLKCEHRMLVYDEVHDVEREFAASSVFAAMRLAAPVGSK